MSDAPLQRDGKAVTRSRSLQRLRDSVFSGASIFLIVLGFVVCSLNAYNMGYVNAKLVMAPMLRELARFQLLVKGHSACVIPGICARLRTTLSNYDSAEEAEGLKWAQAEKMTAKLDGARQMEVAVDCARRGDYFGPLDSLPTAR